MKYLYIDESIGEQLFVVGGILADSEEDLLFAYRQLKKQISRIPMTRKQKESVMNEFKSVILERTYPQIKRRLLYKINSFRCTVVYAVTAKSKCPESDLIICPETAHLGDFE